MRLSNRYYSTHLLTVGTNRSWGCSSIVNAAVSKYADIYCVELRTFTCCGHFLWQWRDSLPARCEKLYVVTWGCVPWRFQLVSVVPIREYYSTVCRGRSVPTAVRTFAEVTVSDIWTFGHLLLCRDVIPWSDIRRTNARSDSRNWGWLRGLGWSIYRNSAVLCI